MLKENVIATQALDICFRLHRQYGPGLFESVYEELICYEMNKAGLLFKRQTAIPLVHGSVTLEAGFRADIIVENLIILELKSVAAFADVPYKQFHTYLKLTGLRLGLLIHFNVSQLKNGIHRIANNLLPLRPPRETLR